MGGFVGVLVSDPWLQSQFTQVQLRTLKSKFISMKNESGSVAVGDLPPIFAKLKGFNKLSEDEIKAILGENNTSLEAEIDFESFLGAYLNIQALAAAKTGFFRKVYLLVTQLLQGEQLNIQLGLNHYSHSRSTEYRNN